MSRPSAGIRHLLVAVVIATLFLAARMSAAPANDNFTKSISIASAGGTVTGTNVDATKQSSEPNHGGNPGGKSVWWNWTASSTGSVTLSTAGSNFDTLLGVYTGPSVGNLTIVGSSDDIGDETTSELAFAAVSGTTYRIAVDGWSDPGGGTADSGNITLTVTPGGTPPANDNFASAIAINAAGGTVNGSNVNATRQGGEPIFADDSGERSVWWSWTPAQSGHALIETAGSSFDTILGVFTGSAVNSLTLVGENDDAGDQVTSSVLLSVTSGTTYRIAVDGWGGATGSINLTTQILQVSAPGNDDFADAFTIPDVGGDTTGSNIDATKETGEPAHAGDTGGHSVWWNWTAPANGTATISTTGSSFDTLLGVYTGNAVGTLTEMAASDDDGGSTTSRVEFAAVSGTTYRIAVDGWGGAVGNVSLSTQFAPASAPGNDAFASAFTLTGSSDSTIGANFAATKETGEPAHAGNSGGHSVWWTWTAPSSGTATISTSGSSFDTLLGVYTGASVGALSEVASSNDDGGVPTSRVEFAAVSGMTYRVAVDGANGAVGNVSLSVLLVVILPPANDAFSAAIAFPGEGGNTFGTNAGATKEVDEPVHAGNSGGKSVWWNWTAAITGTATINTTGSNFDTLLAVYTGASVGGLSVVASSDDFGESTTSLVEFSATVGTTYRIAVDGFNDGGTVASGPISLSVFNVPPPPPAPVASAATSVTTSGFTANWSASAGAAGYRLDVSTSNTFANYVTGYQDLDVGNFTNRAVSGLTAGTSYYYRVRAYSGSGTSTNSGTITVATSNPPPPGATVASAATAITTTGFTANWTATSGATGYRIDVSTSNTFANYVTGYQNLDVGNVTNRAVSGLTASTTYYYRVRAYNGSGTGLDSGTIFVTTSSTPPPAPGATVASAATAITTTGFTANWSATSGATGYRIDVSTSNTFANYVTGYQNLDVGNVTNRAVSGLTAGTTYYYRVRAYNGSGTGPDSGVISVTTATTPPPAPGATVATAATAVTTTGFTANWTATSGATGYRIDVSTSNTFANYVTGYQNLDVGNVTSRVVSALAANTTYHYRVRAYNGSGTGPNSATITIATGTAPFAGLTNISARAFAGSGGNTLIIGFYISGTAAKTLIIRGVGPGLLPLNIPGLGEVVADPSLALYSSTGTLINSNNDWAPELAPDFATVGAFSLPTGSKDAALKVTLAPGLYTVHLVNSGAVAEAIIEVYDRSKNSDSRLSNVSCRLKLNAGQTITLGSYLENKTAPVLLRGVGPTLLEYDETLAVLADPFLRLFSGSTEIGSNDDWDISLQPFFLPSGAFNLTPGSKDAAMRPTLGTGGITVQATGKGGGGVTLVELYDAN